jgi:ParB-like chromosome segregation protein Spo0J
MRLPLSEPTLFPLEPNATSTKIPQFERRAVGELKPHPALVRMQMLPSPARLAELEGLGDRLFEEPIVITHEGFIVDGHARWRIARQRERETLVCEIRVLSLGDALVCILERDRQHHWFNSYCRVELALLLEPGLSKRAEANQSNAGQDQCPSNLTRSKPIDCRPEIARLARVSTGNVSKVRTIRDRGIRRLKDELRAGRMSIHAAWKLAQMSPAEQESSLGWRRTRARRARRLDKLLALAESSPRSCTASLRQIWMALRELKTFERLLRLAVRIDELLLAIEYELQSDEEGTKAGHK